MKLKALKEELKSPLHFIRDVSALYRDAEHKIKNEKRYGYDSDEIEDAKQTYSYLNKFFTGKMVGEIMENFENNIEGIKRDSEEGNEVAKYIFELMKKNDFFKK